MYTNISTLTDTQAAQLHELYQHEWWSQGRQAPDIQKMLLNSDYIFGICEAHSQRLVAFARVLSDRMYRAIVFDVIVAADCRGMGLGHSLLKQIVHHSELSQIECIHLFCLPEMIPFYEKLGFVQAKPSLLVRSATVV
jgi:predicted GNAT family N-acyltransferase